MALTYTPEVEIGRPCPQFELPAVDGKVYALDSFANSVVLVVMFICNHCPYVKSIEDRLLVLARNFKKQDVAFVAICSNDPADYPEDSFENLKKRWQEKSYPFPYLHDADQSIAKAFDAVCTPDFFVYDHKRTLKYRGRLDNSWKAPEKVTSEDLKLAIQLLLEGKPLPEMQYPSMGCSIKWIS